MHPISLNCGNIQVGPLLFFRHTFKGSDRKCLENIISLGLKVDTRIHEAGYAPQQEVEEYLTRKEERFTSK